MVQTDFLASSTNTGAMPPEMHFLTQAAPEPACLAPHMESEIQPLIWVESAALAATHAHAQTSARTATTRFIPASRRKLESSPPTIMLFRGGFRQERKR